MNAVLTDLWPYLVLLLVGFLPNEIWRVLRPGAGAGLNEDPRSWVVAIGGDRDPGRHHRQADPVLPRGLATIPLPVRVTAAVCGFLAFLAVKRSVFVGVAVGEVALLLGGFFVRALTGRDRGGKPLGLVGQHRRLFLDARRRLQGHAVLRGMTWTWRWKTTWPPARLVELLHRQAVGGKDLHCGPRDLLRDLDDDGRDRPARYRECCAQALSGCTSVWPGARGMMSRKAKALSSS